MFALVYDSVSFHALRPCVAAYRTREPGTIVKPATSTIGSRVPAVTQSVELVASIITPKWSLPIRPETQSAGLHGNCENSIASPTVIFFGRRNGTLFIQRNRTERYKRTEGDVILLLSSRPILHSPRL